MAQRAAWTLVPLAGIAFTAPRKGERRTRAIRVAFTLSVVLAAFASIASLSVIPSFTRIASENRDALWVASNIYVSALIILSLVPNRSRPSSATPRGPFVVAVVIALGFAALPSLFRLVSIDGTVAFLVVSLVFSIAIFVSVPLAQRWNAKGSDALKSRRSDALSGDVLSLLSAREIEIANLLAEGRTNAEIADTLCISPKTVETHISNIFRKTGVTNRVQLARSLLRSDQG